MTTDFRALCAELLRELEHATHDDYQQGLKNRARAALAEPQPKPPTKTELKQLFDDCSGYIDDEQVMWWSDFHAAARSVLAQWGRPLLRDVDESGEYRIVSPEFYNAACAVLKHRGNNPEIPGHLGPPINGDLA